MRRIVYTSPADLVRQLLKLNGAAFAGYNHYNGCRYRVATSTLRAMERRGEVVLSIGPDGGTMAKPLVCAYCGGALSPEQAAAYAGYEENALCTKCQKEVAP